MPSQQFYRELNYYYDWVHGSTRYGIGMNELAQKRTTQKTVQLYFDTSITPDIFAHLDPGDFPVPNYGSGSGLHHPFLVAVSGTIHSDNAPDFDFDFANVGVSIPLSFYLPKYYLDTAYPISGVAGDISCDFCTPIYLKHETIETIDNIEYYNQSEATFWLAWIQGESWRLGMQCSWAYNHTDGEGGEVVGMYWSLNADSPTNGSWNPQPARTYFYEGPTVNFSNVSLNGIS